MTEFNAQEIIDYLNQKLDKDISIKCEFEMDDDCNISIISLPLIQKHTENVRKVERYAVEVETLNPCLTCSNFTRVSDNQKACHRTSCDKEAGPSHWEPRYTFEDFK